MPKNWKTYRLEDIVDQERGISYGIVQPGTHDPKGVPILKINNLTNKSFNINDLHFASPSVEEKYLRTRLKGGELLLSLVGSLGEVFSVPVAMKGLNVVRALAVIPVLSDFSPKWVEYWLKSPFAQNLLNQIATTSVQATINLKELRKIEIPFPEKKERETIASILSALDDKIYLNLQMNKTLEEMALALYKHWFVDFGPFQNGEFVESELGMIPKGWEVKRLEEFAKLEMGQSPKSEFYNEQKEGLPFHQGVTGYGDRFPKDTIYSTSGNRKANLGDILFSVRAPVGRINIAKNKIILGRGLSAMHMRGYNNFLFYALKKMFTSEDVIGSGTVFNSVNKTDLQNMEFIIPDDEVLISFKNLVFPLDEQYLANYNEIQTLTTLRDTILPKLISGEVRVKDIKQTIAQVL